MPCSARNSRQEAQTRIHWTRARAKAARATEREQVMNPNATTAIHSSSFTARSRPDSEEDPIAGHHMRKLKAEIGLELGEEVTVVSEEWTRSLYANIVTETALDAYLASATSGYQEDQKRWTRLTTRPTEESELYGPVAGIISDVVSHLGEPCREGVTRQVVNSHTSTFKQPKYKDICPDLCIKATGPSFERGSSDYIEGVGYSNVASLIDVHLDGHFDDLDQAIQMGFYSRQIYLRQPNRNFVRSLVVTENSVRMLHYDRSGFYLTPFINIHHNPRTFIRLILGLSSPNETTLGFDTSIQWELDPATGAKVAGTIETTDSTGQSNVYDLNMDRPPFSRGHILGRGTICWHATHHTTGAEVVIKDAWRPASKVSECDLLNAAQGLDGVVQMISFQDQCAETRAYRPPGFVLGGFESRIKSRTVMRSYGKSIQYFTSRYQAISALRDALAGHRSLRAAGILHRDVSLQNILLGLPDAPPGVRGILIDLDMACWTWDLSRLRAETGLGTRRFQSVAVLQNFELKLPPRHDHLDDLESFFHVLCNLVLLFEGPGVRAKEMDQWLAKCETLEDPTQAGLIKAGFLIRSWPVAPWWGEACRKLFRSFKAIVNNIAGEKHSIQQGTESMTPEEQRDALEAMVEDTEDIYDKVIELFDDALAAIEKEDETLNSTPTENSAGPVVASEKPKTIASLKRLSTDEHPDAPPPKRLSPPLIAHAASPEKLPSPEVRPQAPLPRLRRSERSIHPVVASDKPKAIASLKRRSTDEHPDTPPPKRLSPPPIARAASPEKLPSPEVRPEGSLPRLRRSGRSIPTAEPTPTLAPPAGPHPKVIAIRKDAPPKHSLPASSSKARSNPKKRTQDTRPKASPPKAVRRSARLNRV